MTALMTEVHIGIQRGGGLIGLLNRLVTRSRFGHALIAFSDGFSFSADGRHGWGWLMTWDIKVPTRWYVLAVTTVQAERIRHYCGEHVGAKYDWVSVFKFTLLCRLLFNSRERRRDRLKFFCSEGVYLAVSAGTIRLLGEVEAWEVAPGHFRFSPLLTRGIPRHYEGPLL